MRVLIAPDSFKGSMSAREVCEVVAESIRAIIPQATIDKLPMADGGEGTVEAMVYNDRGRIVECFVDGPLGEKRSAKYGIINQGKVAVMEMAEAAGLANLKEEQRNPLIASTIGVGQMIKDALDKGCSEILMGIGGSATNDGGMGMLIGLGYVFYDAAGNKLTGCGQNLLKVRQIDQTGADKRLGKIKVRVACDVDNPLLGRNGATSVYGPQKGASPKMVQQLEAGMENYATVVAELFGQDKAKIKGAGAAGGLGFGLMSFLAAELKPGFEMVSEAVGLEKRIKQGNYDWIVTGEGQINAQTLNGKLPYGVARLGKKYNQKVIAIVGSIGPGYQPLQDCGINGIFSIMNQPMSLQTAMENSKELLRDTVERIFRLLSSLAPKE